MPPPPPTPDEVNEYVKKHELETVLAKVLNATITAQPEEPVLEMARRLEEVADARGEQQ